MRTKLKPKNFEDGDWFEKECAFMDCASPVFYTNNINAMHCCDSHRFKTHQIRHKLENDFLNNHAKKFKKNRDALKWLYSIKIFDPTRRDLLVSGFDLSVRNAELKSGDISIFKYFDYLLEIKNTNTYEIKLNKN